MTRPRKQTVDYFPHSCHHGKTMSILEHKFGNDGYAFWFKLLEQLGITEGHFIDCNDLANWHFLCTRTRVDDRVAIEIINMLADIDAIDKELWEVKKIIWSSKFVENLAFAYRNREVSIPVKPEIECKKTRISGVSGVRNPQMKVNEMKVNERKDIASPGVPPVAALNFYSCQFFEVDFEYRMKLAKEYPALNDDLLKAEFSKMEDWITDNKKKKTFKANGHLGNPRLFIKNWLNRVMVDGQKIFGGASPEPKGWASLREAERRRKNAE